MWIRLRQVAIAATDLREASLDMSMILGLEACFTDPGVATFGLKNTLWPLGSQFLEVVTPTAPGTAAGRYIDRRGGDTGYMVITQVDDLQRRRSRVAELGVRVAFDFPHAEDGHDGIQLHPADTGGSFFEMEQMTNAVDDRSDGPWWPAGKNWQSFVRTDRVTAICGAELQSPDPQRLADRWSAIAEIDLVDDASGNPTMSFGELGGSDINPSTIRFVEAVDGRGEGLGAIDVVAPGRADILAGAKARDRYVDDDQVVVAGLRVNLVS